MRQRNERYVVHARVGLDGVGHRRAGEAEYGEDALRHLIAHLKKNGRKTKINKRREINKWRRNDKRILTSSNDLVAVGCSQDAHVDEPLVAAVLDIIVQIPDRLLGDVPHLRIEVGIDEYSCFQGNLEIE